MNATLLCRTLPEKPFYILYQFVAAPGRERETPPEWHEWSWLSPLLLEAIGRDFKIVTPQVVGLICDEKSGPHDRTLEFDENQQPRMRVDKVFRLNRERASLLFPMTQSRCELVQALLRSDDCETQWSPEIQAMVNDVRRDLQRWRYVSDEVHAPVSSSQWYTKFASEYGAGNVQGIAEED
ncbi:MAG: hypothetical protein JXL80_15045 [Planctomycetes bacterium]|nr:hypothetical protein [Planctomycetota bacterium]